MQIQTGRLIGHVHPITDHFDGSQRFYRAVVGVLGRLRSPVERDPHAGYCGAFLLDPDCDNVEAAFHGPVERPADVLTIRYDR